MMPRRRYTVAGVLLLCAVKALCSDGVVGHKCPLSWEVTCFKPSDHLNVSDRISLDLTVGNVLMISLDGLSNNSVCQFGKAESPGIEIVDPVSVVIPQLSSSDSGLYSLRCTTQGDTEPHFNKTVELHVLDRPSKPQLFLDKMDRVYLSPVLKCISKDSPGAKMEWFGLTQKSDTTRVSISTTEFNKQAMCCVTNKIGQECTQLYDFDVSTNDVKQDEVSTVTISPGEPLVLRCRTNYKSEKNWEHNGMVLVDKKNGMHIKKDQHRRVYMVYAFFEAVAFAHSGNYTCRSSNGSAKNVVIHVTNESLLSSQLPDQFLITKSNSCLTADVSYHPVLQHCYWEAPDTTFTECIRDERVVKHRTVKYCKKLQSGMYKLHLRAGGKNETKNTTVCVAETPNPKIIIEHNGLVAEAVSILPTNLTWSSSFGDSSETISSWKVIKKEYWEVEDGFCNQKVKSSVKHQEHQGSAKHFKFCLSNQAGSWCTEYNVLEVPIPMASRGDPPSDDSFMLLKIGTFSLLLALAVVSVLLLYFIRKKKPQYQPQLQMIQMVGPNDNDYIYINFKDFNYDKKWEFPRENLELGKELGSGAFGMVVQATAYGINQPGLSQQVAVKMLKEKHQSVEKEALMSELKMLTHIGQHDNIVNLLGACTETGPIYLIFQYCCYGDLLNYLKKSGDRYNKSVTDAFNRDRFSCLYNNLQPKKNSSELITAANNYMPMHGSTTREQEGIDLITFSSNDMEDPQMYESEDDQRELQAITFDDLLSFAFQVAKGMEFLSSKNCIHRDLAARNVLVTKGRLVKIGDFGLARDIDNDSNYVVRGNVRLPVKWMAPESIFQGMYTMKSDVWAYGILLWEIFSLGVTPYPGVKVDHVFYSMIERGFKMECPYYANDSVYDIMLKCWALDPCNRPSFSKLVDLMSEQLMDSEEMLYQSMLDQSSSDYQNTSTIVDITALAKDSESKTATANDYCKANIREETKAEASKSEGAMGEKEVLLKFSDDV